MAGIDLYLQNLRDYSRASSPENKAEETNYNYESEFSSPALTSERGSNYLKYISVSFYIKLTFLVARKLFILLISNLKIFLVKIMETLTDDFSENI